MRSSPLLIPLPDYERMFRVIHSVTAASDRLPHKACILISACGAYLLNKFYGIKAHVVAGTAIYGLDGQKLGAVIGSMKDGQPYSDHDNFHMWVETQSHVFDFQAPLFREMLAGHDKASITPRKMFQRPLSEQCKGAFAAPGDFDLFPDSTLTREITDAFFSGSEGADLMLCCESWFTRPPKKMKEAIGMLDSLAGSKIVRLSPIRLTGAWGR